MRRNLLITICILILSSVCLFAETSLGSIRFDYNIFKESVGTVSSVYFVDANGNRVTQSPIDMNIDNTFDSYTTPQLYFVQENNLKADDSVRRVKLYFSFFTPSDGNNAGFKGNYAVFLWRLNDPTNIASGLKSKRDKALNTAIRRDMDFGLDNSNSQNGEPIACYYPLSFAFDGTYEIDNGKMTEIHYLDTYQPGEYSATITVELQGN